jgi:6-oxo-cyclohex-1-ene-carbonyl-CoA hydrolase
VWSAHKALRLGLLTDIAPALLVDGRFVPNPLVVADRVVEEWGREVFGERRRGEDLAAGKAMLARGTVDLAHLDEAVEALATRLLMTMPGCLSKTLQSVRKHKLEHWDRNRETNRAWLALNMMTEAHAGFRAFERGVKGNREVDFVELRRRLARGETWDQDLIEAVQPRAPEGVAP